MEYKTKPSGKPSDYYVIGLVGGGLLFWILAGRVRFSVAVLQLVSIMMFSLAMYLLIRYRLTVFRFRIEGRNGCATDINTAMPAELDFVIEKMRGGSAVTLARLSLAELRRADIVPTGDLKKLSGVECLFRYEPDMSPEEGILLVFYTDGRNIAIFTDFPPDMFNFLKRITDSNINFDTNE